MSLAKRDRQDLKALALVAGRREAERERERQREREAGELVSLRGSFESRGERIGVDGMPDKLGPVGASGAGEWRGLRRTRAGRGGRRWAPPGAVTAQAERSSC